MATKTETIFVIYKYGEYFSEGNKDELSAKTGLRAKYIEELSCPSKNIKKWQVDKLITRRDQFADFDEVDYARLKELIRENNYNSIELAELLEVHPMTVDYKLKKDIRFQYKEIETLEDLFYLDDGELLRGAG